MTIKCFTNFYWQSTHGTSKTLWFFFVLRHEVVASSCVFHDFFQGVKQCHNRPFRGTALF